MKPKPLPASNHFTEPVILLDMCISFFKAASGQIIVCYLDLLMGALKKEIPRRSDLLQYRFTGTTLLK
jgi:hypothetical protein